MLLFRAPFRVGHNPFHLGVHTFLGSFGASVDFRLEYHSHPRNHPRVVLTRKQAVSDILKAGQVKVAIFHDERLEAIHSVAFRPSALQHLLEAIALVRNSKPLFFEEDGLHYWQELALNEHYASCLTRRDRLSIGWYMRAFGACSWLTGFLNSAREESRNGSSIQLDGLPDSLRSTLQVMSETDFSCTGLMSYLQATTGTDFPRLIEYARDIHESGWAKREDLSFGIRSSVLWGFDLLLQSAGTTECGQYLLWLNPEQARFSRLKIEPTHFPGHARPEDFWPRIRRGLHMGYGVGLKGSDFPADQTWIRTAFSEFPQADDLQAVKESANVLLDEALASKQFTIPPAAVIQLKVGPFSHFEMTECGDGVWCVFRREDGEFMSAHVVPKEHLVFFELPYPDKYCRGVDSVASLTPEVISRIEAAVKLLICAVIRDFWVVENREAVFAARRSGRERTHGDEARPRVVYLPRIIYANRSDTANCSQQLAQVERRKHFVRAHIRRAEHPSEKQLFLAQRYGFDVPTGYTFVRPYEKGEREREVIYRSRSALQCLYQTDSSIDSGRCRWFEFERDVLRLMEKLGFEVQWTGTSSKGDHGVDLYATKGLDLEEVKWVIQCKCWRSNRSVTPGVVRELEGVLSKYPQGTRGMIVTTSRFSSGAIERARSAGIRLIDGEEFVSMLCDAE